MSIQARFKIDRGDFTLDVDLELPNSGVTALFGPSGSGKTTALRCMAGLERAPGGLLKVGDEVWQDDEQKVFLPTHKRPLGYVFQEVVLFPHLSVRGNLNYAFKHVPADARRVAFDDAVDLLGLGQLIDRTPSGLSGGERQRVAIARALLTSPRLLLMDEPLAALDQKSKSEILPYLETLHAELSTPVIYVSHSPDEVARLADHMVLLDEGRVMATGPLSEILTRLDLPLAHGDVATAILEAEVASHDEEFQLTKLNFAGGSITLPKRDFEVGRKLRVSIHARDVSVTLARSTDTSILNVFPATVAEVSSDGDALVMLQLAVNGTKLLSRITRKSAAALDLKPGRSVFAQVKSVASVE